MLTQYILKMPHVVYSGEGALDHIKEIAGTCAGKAVVFSDKGIMAAGLLEKPLSLLKEAGVGYSVLDGLPAEPDCDEAQKVIDAFKAEKAGLIIHGQGFA